MNLQELRDQKGRLVNEADQILQAALKEERSDLRKEENEKFDAIHADIDKLSAFIVKLEKQESLAEGTGRRSEPPAPTSSQNRRGGVSVPTEQERVEAFRAWALAGSKRANITDSQRAAAARCGYDLTSNEIDVSMFGPTQLRSTHPDTVRAWREESRTALTGLQSTTTTGGYTVPDSAMQALEVALLAFGGVRSVATVIRTATGSPLPFPTVNDTTAKGRLISENTAVTETEMTFGQLVLDAFKFSSDSILASVEFLQDSAINPAEYIGSALGTRIGRLQNDYFTTGTGSSQPKGVVAGASAGTAAASQTLVTYDELVGLVHAVDPAYRGNAKFMFPDTMLKNLKKIKILQYSGDTVGVPLWQPSLSNGVADTIMGYPYVINQSMATPATGTKSILFGDFSKYLIRDVRDVTLVRLDELYAAQHSIGFLAFARSDGDLLDAGTHPIYYMAQA